MKDLILKHKVFVCAGSGGVGKTTVSSSVALLAASLGKKVLLFTIDPSRRLATCLGLEGWKGEETSVKKFENGGELFASMVDHQKIFDDFVREHSNSQAEAESLLNNRLYKELSTNLSGSQEFTSLRALEKAVSANKYDFIVLDTPPAQHTIDFVKAPQTLYNLFSGPVVEWFRKLTNPKRGFLGLINKGTQAAISVLEKITGAEFIHELQEFFVQISSWSPAIQDMVIRTQNILTSQSTAFLVVTNLDDSRLIEAKENIKEFKRQGFQIKSIVVNKSTPIFEDVESCSPEIQSFYKMIVNSEYDQINSFLSKSSDSVEIYILPKANNSEDELATLTFLSQKFTLQNIDTSKQMRNL